MRINARHLVNRSVQHGGQAGTIERTQNLLCFSEGITEQNRDFAAFDGFATECDDLTDDFVSRREAVPRQTIGRLHDKYVGGGPTGRLGRLPRAKLEIAGVKQGVVLRTQKKLG